VCLHAPEYGVCLGVGFGFGVGAGAGVGLETQSPVSGLQKPS